MIRQLLPIVFFITILGALSAQKRLYPVRSGNMYGLMDALGNEVVSPTYQYIGKYSNAGYAIAEKNSLLGVLDTTGQLQIACKHQFLNQVGKGLFSVKNEGTWQIINTQNEVVFDSMPGKITFLSGKYVSFSEITGVGLAHIDSGVLIRPIYDRYQFLAGGLVLPIKDELKYVFDGMGNPLIKAGCVDVKNEGNCLWIQRDGKWMAYSPKGVLKKRTVCDDYERVGIRFYKLFIGEEIRLYDINQDTIILSGMSQYIVFDSSYVRTIGLDEKEGLIDNQGNIIIPTEYAEITKVGKGLLRVKNSEGKYGVFDYNGNQIIAFNYDYINRFSTAVAKVRLGDKYAIINILGKIVVPVGVPSYADVESNMLRYRDSKRNLQIIHFDEQGEVATNSQFKNIKSLRINAFGSRRFSGGGGNGFDSTRAVDPNQISDSLVWKFHNPSSRWGLWNTNTDQWKYPPKFNGINIQKKHGFTIVEISKQNVGGQIKTGMLDLKFHKVFGIFNNARGLPVTRINFLDIRLSDFEQGGLDVARVVFVGGKCGLIKKNGKIIASNYTYIGDFVEGKARCATKGRMEVDVKANVERPLTYAHNYFMQFMSGYSIDQDGNPIYFEPFETDGRVHCIESQWGYIDTLGEVVIKPTYDFVENYSNNRAMVKRGNKWGLLGEDGNLVLETQYDDFKFLPKSDKKLFYISNNKTLYGAVDTTGKVIVPVQYIKIRKFKEERIAVRNNAMRWGFVDLNSKEVIPCEYRLANDFNEGLAVVYLNSRWGAIDKNGIVVIKPQYSQMSDFCEGKAAVSLGRGFKGYVNKKGQLLFKAKYSRVSDFSQGVASVYIRKKGWGLIDKNGKIIMKPNSKIKKIGLFNEHGLAEVKIGNRYRLLNKQGEFVGKKSFGLIRPFQEGYAVVREQSLSGSRIGKTNFNFTFIDTLGEVISKQDFAQLQSFHQGRAAFRGENGKRGFIDTKGQVVIEPIYFNVENFKNNRAVVYAAYNISGVIDTNGTAIIPVKYKKIVDIEEGLALVRQNSWSYFFVHEDSKRHSPLNFNRAYGFQNQMAPVQVGSKWGLINRQGIETMTPKYAEMKPFDQGIARVAVHKLQGVVNIEGKVVVEPIYEYVEYVGEGLFRIEHGDKIGYLSIDGTWVKPLAQ